jgi:hypothetical protein
VPRDIKALLDAIELDAIYGQGTLALRPTSTPSTPGMQGRFYMATDQTPHALYYDYGTGWDAVGSLASGSIGTAQLADGAVTTIKIADANVTLAKLAPNSVDASKIVDASITVTELANALIPSQGAGNGTEALRAIGSGAGQVVAGNDARLADTRAPSTGHDPSAYGTAFPTTGLYNGYVFKLFVAAQGPGGYVCLSFVYRADLDGTYPWHFAGGGMIANSGSLSGTWNGYADLSGAFTLPRSGWWEGMAHGTGSGASQGAASAILLVGSASFDGHTPLGNSTGFGIAAAFTVQAAGAAVKVQGNNTNVVSYSYSAYFGVRPIRVA